MGNISLRWEEQGSGWEERKGRKWVDKGRVGREKAEQRRKRKESKVHQGCGAKENLT